MPRKPPPEQYRFKPGQSGNPKGRPLNPIPRALKELTVKTYRDVVEAVCTGNIDNLQAMIKDPKVSALQVGIATAFVKALQDGDYATIERIAERIVGKIPDELTVNSRNLNLNANLNATVKQAKVKAAVEELEKEV